MRGEITSNNTSDSIGMRTALSVTGLLLPAAAKKSSIHNHHELLLRTPNIDVSAEIVTILKQPSVGSDHRLNNNKL